MPINIQCHFCCDIYDLRPVLLGIAYLIGYQTAKGRALADCKNKLAAQNRRLIQRNIDLAGRKRAAVNALNQNRYDYICAVRHYYKYGGRYTSVLPSQWYALEFGSFEDYPEFRMQLVFLLGEAKKKWGRRARGPQEAGEESG